MQEGKQPLRARLQLLAWLTLNAGEDAANQPSRLAQLDDGNDRAILVQGNEGPAQIVRLGHRATPSIDVSDEIAILAARPIASLRWREMDSNFQFLGTFGSLTDLGDTRAAQRWKHCTKQKVRRRCAGGKWIRIFCSAGGFEASMFVLGRNLAFHRSSGSADRRRVRVPPAPAASPAPEKK